MKSLLLRIKLWYFARLRRTDIEILWPILRAHAPSLEAARHAFAVHIFYNQAWMVLSQHDIDILISKLS